MHRAHGLLSSSPTDLANFLACRHKTTLDLLVAQGALAKPVWDDPFVDILRARGLDHERRYVASLRASGLRVVEIAADLAGGDAAALQAMRDGADVIVQAPLRVAGWFGFADVLRRVERPCRAFGAWSYEAHDTKLTRETKGGTILQLCVYSDMLGELQGVVPERFGVVTPERAESYRFDDFAAFYRWAKAQYSAFIAGAPGDADSPRQTYPVPADHCEVCRWWDRCNAQRRQDDHLTFVAGLGRSHLREWSAQEVSTLAALAGVPVPLAFRPRKGGRETYEKQREQARVQAEQRTTLLPVYELLAAEAGHGLAILPEPSAGDLFLDLEGDPFAREGGREYLFGLGRLDGEGGVNYAARWAWTDGEERAAFEALIDDIMAALAADPALHVYHFAPYEPAALKRLAGRYATREAALDVLLRGGRFVDLYAALRQGVRAGVERYSIKAMERFYNFTRAVDLRRAADERRLIEIALETHDLSSITGAIRETVAGYNRDDVRSTQALRNWLETLRAEAIAGGAAIVRPAPQLGDAADSVKERDRRAVALREQLLAGVPLDGDRTPEQQALWLLAFLIDWHRREERVAWGEYHRLREKPDEELADEPGALTGLTRIERLPQASARATTVTDRYRFPVQEVDIRAGDDLRLVDDTKFGTVSAIDKTAGTVDVKKTREATDLDPATVISLRIIGTKAQEESIHRVAEAVIRDGLTGVDPLVRDLLCANPPRLADAAFAARRGEAPVDFAIRAVRTLAQSALPIQGPPGAGKTYTGAHMIAALVADGRKVGVVATGHRVIRKLIVDAVAAGRTQGAAVVAAHKPGDDELPHGEGITIEEPEDNAAALRWLTQPGGRVLGGTSWLWARPEFAHTVDVLFVDEAGQMSLANVLAVSPAAANLVLLGDPQQLEQPQKGSHPDGVDVSALEHLLLGHQTVPIDRGIFLPVTWRLAPTIASFTSELFYEGKLHARPGLERQRLDGTPFRGAGLWTVAVDHDGCSNASDEEVAAIVQIVNELTAAGSTWTGLDADGRPTTRDMTLDDVLVVAPYNAQVARLKDALGAAARVGTVDKFQGQEAPVVIYSMTSSSADDAPRGMEFLYSANRLNVATSRARCACLLVASPRLFEPECRSPRQMQLANALCRFRELSTRVLLHG